MESEYKYICPRPRISRACGNCKLKRTRCFRDTPNQPCERCQNLKLECKLATIRAKDLKKTKPEETDVISELFQTKQQSPPATNLIEIHHQRFQEKFSIPGPEDEVSLPSCLDESESRPHILDQTKADQLLNKFRAKNSYFPFVTIPENIDSADHRFLYLAVLTAASSDDMGLLWSLDDRFRSILAERVIMLGEKSLDYLQGLLVYLAWYNLHLHPRGIQVYQYLHIAISMLEDLGYSNNEFLGMTPSDIIAAKNACLGCYFLSSVFTTCSKRSNNAVFSDHMKAYLLQLPENGCPQSRAIYLSFQFQVAIESAYKRDCIDTHYSEIKNFSPNDSLNPTSTSIARKFLSLMEVTGPSLRGFTMLQPQPHKFQPIMAKGREFFDHFTSIPMSHFSGFTMAEWNRLICTIHILIEALSAFTGTPQSAVAIREESQRATIYIECLANRMEKMSRSGRNPNELPDMFYMFKSILDLLTPLPFADECDNGQQSQQGQCPYLRGLRDTDFWDAYQSGLSLVSPPDEHDMGIDIETLFQDNDCSIEPHSDECLNGSFDFSGICDTQL
ncbi:hypothetical protein BGW36DRAFT_53065 [Talaromyces proteolyticus]|uniref:Zn(2)-C6 fungal-type domain-containing protein n=1 Tax=Talaromyces proteolyticus TaxID=1131652 RepID=A0AAD4KGW6_9EURO|nr:uncharacterized protein BGW36DRAFT_53065 [Talaromyces proteolyticus]KAH8691450.1 hypothetical protein BGW36DRAFT_53065 [Talaromyces proteolyticus]